VILRQLAADWTRRRRARSLCCCAVTWRWQTVHRVRRLSTSQVPPPSATGTMWSTFQNCHMHTYWYHTHINYISLHSSLPSHGPTFHIHWNSFWAFEVAVTVTPPVLESLRPYSWPRGQRGMFLALVIKSLVLALRLKSSALVMTPRSVLEQ